MLYRANLFEESLEAFEKASDWRMFLSSLMRIKNLVQPNLIKYLTSIAGKFIFQPFTLNISVVLKLL